MRTDAEIRAAASAAGFEDIADELVQLARPGLALDAGARPPVGRLGGRPRLPAGDEWPRTRWPHSSGHPLAFVAELDLAHLDGAIWPGPTDGTLNVFCFIDAEALYVDSGGSALVVHHPAGTAPAEHDVPDDLDEELRFTAIPVGAVPVSTLPWAGAREFAPLGVDPFEDYDRAETYMRLTGEVRGVREAAPYHQLLGWPRFTQDDVATSWPVLHAESRSFGLVSEPATGRDWRLLLQVAGDEQLGAEFADGGVLMFGIPAEDLAAGRFDRVEAISDSG